MAMEEEEESCYRAHVLVLPFHGQGHLNPMLHFSQRLASNGIKTTLAATLSATKTIPPQIVGSIILEPIYDDLTHGGFNGTGGFKGFIERFQSIGSQNLTELVKKHEKSKCPIKCLVYDVSFPWCLDLAKQLGIMGAAFVTQSCATMANYLRLLHDDSGESDGSLEELGISFLPSMGSGTGRFPAILNFILSQFAGVDKADWVLFNSFDKLEEEVVKDLLKLYKVRTIGPTVPSMYLDKQLEGDKDDCFNLSQSTDDTCISWLNKKETGSVVYVAFGSVVILNAEQMEELAWGLKQSNTNFLWVIRGSEDNKLPTTFEQETSEKGLVVTWCPQLEVLAHKAVGCFMTHCGWNSTVEGVSMGVPMIAMPQFLDQFTDAKFVEEVWEVGLRPKLDEKSLVTREEIERCIKEIMHGEKGEKIKRNASKWKELAKEAVDEGGTSDGNIVDIVAGLISY